MADWPSKGAAALQFWLTEAIWESRADALRSSDF